MPPLDDRHSARRGAYLVLHRIDDSDRIRTVLTVAPRSTSTDLSSPATAHRAGCLTLGPSYAPYDPDEAGVFDRAAPVRRSLHPGAVMHDPRCVHSRRKDSPREGLVDERLSA